MRKNVQSLRQGLIAIEWLHWRTASCSRFMHQEISQSKDMLMGAICTCSDCNMKQCGNEFKVHQQNNTPFMGYLETIQTRSYELRMLGGEKTKRMRLHVMTINARSSCIKDWSQSTHSDWRITSFYTYSDCGTKQLGNEFEVREQVNTSFTWYLATIQTPTPHVHWANTKRSAYHGNERSWLMHQGLIAIDIWFMLYIVLRAFKLQPEATWKRFWSTPAE